MDAPDYRHRAVTVGKPLRGDQICGGRSESGGDYSLFPGVPERLAPCLGRKGTKNKVAQICGCLTCDGADAPDARDIVAAVRGSSPTLGGIKNFNVGEEVRGRNRRRQSRVV